MKPYSSMFGRALLAVGLTVGFYLLTLSMVVALALVPYVELKLRGDYTAYPAVLCIAGALVILVSILPRRDRFIVPGQALDLRKHPKLFGHVQKVADATGQTMPQEVYLLPEMNAMVLERGGVMGFGSRRVMTIGVPLLQVLNISELKAVFAHEFGHFYSGDTKLGPWVYQTRAAIMRTLLVLPKQGPVPESADVELGPWAYQMRAADRRSQEMFSAYGSILRKPFEWYGKVFLRMTHGVARHQEMIADELAARTMGRKACIGAFKKSEGGVAAFAAYWYNDFLPVLVRGYSPPLLEGFQQFLKSPRTAEFVEKSIATAMKEEKTEAYDTHPALHDRVKAVEAFPDMVSKEEESEAISLLENLAGVEAEFLDRLTAHEPKSASLRTEKISWEEVGTKVWIPGWESRQKEFDEAVKGITANKIPQVVADLEVFGQKVEEVVGGVMEPDERDALAESLLGGCLSVALHRSGWLLRYALGGSPSFEHEGYVIHPFELVTKLKSGEMSSEEWTKLCVAAAISDLDLGHQRE